MEGHCERMRSNGHELQQEHFLTGHKVFTAESGKALEIFKTYVEQVSQDHGQAGFEYLQKRRLHNLPGQLVPVLCHPLGVFLIFRWNFSLYLLPFILSLGTTENSLAPSA